LPLQGLMSPETTCGSDVDHPPSASDAVYKSVDLLMRRSMRPVAVLLITDIWRVSAAEVE
jgi:hypothetical protein